MPREIENPGGYALEHAATSIGCVLAAAKDGMGDDVSSGLAECMAAQLIRYRVPTWFRALS